LRARPHRGRGQSPRHGMGQRWQRAHLDAPWCPPSAGWPAAVAV